jgi:hypothetical protein
MVDGVDLAGARSVTPSDVPVNDPEPLTGKERAGILVRYLAADYPQCALSHADGGFGLCFWHQSKQFK